MPENSRKLRRVNAPIVFIGAPSTAWRRMALLIDQSEVEQPLSTEQAIDEIESMFQRAGHKSTENPARMSLPLGEGFLGYGPAVLHDSDVVAFMLWAIFGTGRLAEAQLQAIKAVRPLVQKLNLSLDVQKTLLPFNQVADMSLARDAHRPIDGNQPFVAADGSARGTVASRGLSRK